jgi:hypothetical protein
MNLYAEYIRHSLDRRVSHFFSLFFFPYFVLREIERGVCFLSVDSEFSDVFSKGYDFRGARSGLRRVRGSEEELRRVWGQFLVPAQDGRMV